MKHVPTILLITFLPMIAACSSPDDRLARLAERSAQQQAEQNQTIADVTNTANENHRRVVEAVEKSRQSVADLEREVRQQHDRLDQERRSLADERHRESLLAPVLHSIGLLLVAALPLVIAIYLLHGLRGRNDDEAVSEVMLRELLANETPFRIGQADPTQRIEQISTSHESPEQEPPF